MKAKLTQYQYKELFDLIDKEYQDVKVMYDKTACTLYEGQMHGMEKIERIIDKFLQDNDLIEDLI